MKHSMAVFWQTVVFLAMISLIFSSTASGISVKVNGSIVDAAKECYTTGYCTAARNEWELCTTSYSPTSDASEIKTCICNIAESTAESCFSRNLDQCISCFNLINDTAWFGNNFANVTEIARQTYCAEGTWPLNVFTGDGFYLSSSVNFPVTIPNMTWFEPFFIQFGDEVPSNNTVNKRAIMGSSPPSVVPSFTSFSLFSSFNNSTAITTTVPTTTVLTSTARRTRSVCASLGVPTAITSPTVEFPNGSESTKFTTTTDLTKMVYPTVLVSNVTSNMESTTTITSTATVYNTHTVSGASLVTASALTSPSSIVSASILDSSIFTIEASTPVTDSISASGSSNIGTIQSSVPSIVSVFTLESSIMNTVQPSSQVSTVTSTIPGSFVVTASADEGTSTSTNLIKHTSTRYRTVTVTEPPFPLTSTYFKTVTHADSNSPIVTTPLSSYSAIVATSSSVPTTATQVISSSIATSTSSSASIIVSTKSPTSTQSGYASTTTIDLSINKSWGDISTASQITSTENSPVMGTDVSSALLTESGIYPCGATFNGVRQTEACVTGSIPNPFIVSSGTGTLAVTTHVPIPISLEMGPDETISMGDGMPMPAMTYTSATHTTRSVSSAGPTSITAESVAALNTALNISLLVIVALTSFMAIYV